MKYVASLLSRRKVFLPTLLVGWLVLGCQQGLQKNIPFDPKQPLIETRFGIQIVDSFTYLEDVKAPQNYLWFAEQDQKADSIINSIPYRDRIRKELDALDQKFWPDVTQQKIIGEKKYYLHRGVLYCQDKSRKGEIELFNIDSLNFTIDAFQPNEDGSKVAFSLVNNSEIGDFALYDIEKDSLSIIAKNVLWAKELNGLQWINNEKLIFTKVNGQGDNPLLDADLVLFDTTDPSQTRLPIFSRKAYPSLEIPNYLFHYPIIRDNYVFCKIASVSHFSDAYFATKAEVAKGTSIPWMPLFKTEDLVKAFEVEKDMLYFLSAKNASNFQIGKTPLAKPDFSSPEIVVAEDPDAVITDFKVIGGAVYFVKTINGVKSSFHVAVNGKQRNINLPKAIEGKMQPSGTIELTYFDATPEKVKLKISGWNFKEEHYWYDTQKETFTRDGLYGVSQTLENIVIEEIEVPAHDGEKVPLTIMHNGAIKKEGNTPLLITAYGSYGDSFIPTYHINADLMEWVSEGGIAAVAHVRGGGEKGLDWHRGGFKQTKPNTWYDFIACTEYFIRENYTRPNKIVAMGFSAGGIGVSRAITERPDLYQAAILGVTPLNMIRAMDSHGGQNAALEFGVVNDSLEFTYLYEMDAYHKIKEETPYPAVYVFTKLNDIRLNPALSTKFVRKLQLVAKPNHPILLDVDFMNGHWFTNGDLANALAFALWQTKADSNLK